MKTVLLALAAIALFASPSFASCREISVGTGPDGTNHQSSLSSTSEGGSTTRCVCTE